MLRRVLYYSIISYIVALASAVAAPSPIFKPVSKEEQSSNKPIIYGSLESEVEIKIQSGDTLSQLLSKQGVGYEDVHSILIALRKVYDPNDITKGQRVTLEFDKSKERLIQLLRLRISDTKDIVVKRINGELFLGSEENKPVDLRLMKAKGIIKSSFYGAMEDAGVPAALIMKLIKLSSYDIDFQREVRKGNRFTVLFEQNYNSDDEVVGKGDIVYAKMVLKHKQIEMYRYETPDGIKAYYDGSGYTVQKSLLRTPVDGARISSGYGMRKHPVLGYSKMHKGMDFAAPIGTPVYAAGNGVITSLGRRGSYGKYIRIDHGNGYATAYAHLHRFAKGKRRTSRVKQGEVIGYVGRTGRVTGPHLHYELLKNGRHVNPTSIKTTPGNQLKSLEYGVFQSYKRKIHKLIR
jgi:murein DD-endopeptidase MepM/ murein hydrolase activator NlpD